MKTLYLIRHAKSSWKDPSLDDHDRPLNKRGFRDGPRMANWLANSVVKPDALISSTALRAHTTANYFAEAWSMDQGAIRLEPGIYEASVRDLLHIIRNCPSTWNVICLFGHNPSFTLLTNQFKGMYIANVPTCGIVRIDIPIEDWSKLDTTEGEIKAFYYPKMFNF